MAPQYESLHAAVLLACLNSCLCAEDTPAGMASNGWATLAVTYTSRIHLQTATLLCQATPDFIQIVYLLSCHRLDQTNSAQMPSNSLAHLNRSGMKLLHIPRQLACTRQRPDGAPTACRC